MHCVSPVPRVGCFIPRRLSPVPLATGPPFRPLSSLQVLLFPAMRPDDTDPKAAGTHKAARALAAKIRVDECKTRGEVVVAAGAAAAHGGAGAASAAAAPLLGSDLLELNGRLVASGLHFLSGSKPGKEDAATYERVNAQVVSGGVKISAATAPGLSRWFDLVGLFAPATRATWA